MNSITCSIKIVFLLAIFFQINTIAQQNSVDLEIGNPIEQTLKGGESHNYRVKLAAGQFLYAVAEQRGIDVVVTLFAPGGEQIFDSDSPNGTEGFEPVWAYAETDGDYRLEVRSLDRNARLGRYEVQIREMRAGIADDKFFVEAQKEVSKASNLIFGEGTPEARIKAKAHFDNAVALFRKIEDKERRAFALEQMGGLIGSWLGRSDDEIALLTEAIPLFKETGKISAAGKAFMDIGDRQSARFQLTESIKTYQEGLALAEAANDKKLVSSLLISLGQPYTLLGDYENGLKYFYQALDLSREIGSTENLAYATGSIGMVYQYQGNYAKSLEFLNRELVIQESAGNTERFPALWLNMGNVYFYQGNDELALNNFRKALAQFEKMPSFQGIVYALNNIGWVYFNRGQYEEAITWFEKAQKARRGNLLKEPNSIMKIGLAYKELGKLTEALDYLEKAKALAEKNGVRYILADVLNGISSVYIAKKDYSRALEICRRVMQLTNEENLPGAYQLALTRLGTINLELGKTSEAKAAFRQAVSVTESQRNNIAGGEQERQQFFEDKDLPYQALIKIFLAEGNLTQSLAYAEQIKSRVLLDVLQNGKIPLKKAMTLQEREAENKLRNDISSLNSQISWENQKPQPDLVRVNELKNRLEKRRLEFIDFQTRLYASHPELRMRRGEMKPLSLEESTKLLPDEKSALLEYVVADDDETFLFVITKDASDKVLLKAYPIEIKHKSLAELIESFRSKLAKGDLDFSTQAKKLYDLLLKPAESQLKNKTNLIIVPDFALWDLPFQALQTAQDKYLIESASVSYAPSLTALREMSNKNRGEKIAGAKLLAFGNPTVNKETSDRVKRVFMSESFAPLPEAERLVTGLQKLYGVNRSRIFVGTEAREETAKIESSKYRIIQFAAHGILNDINPMYSHILLARKDNNLNEDGLLEAWEMMDLELNADMVILSACETARGRVGSGEGVIGMSWALFIAGTPTTVASQWKVESGSTTELMLEFHRQLLNSKGISKAEALRRASLKLMKMPQYKHPSYWAGFVMVGDGF